MKTADAILKILQDVTHQQQEFVPLHEPEFKGNEWTYVKQCIDTGWVSSVGAYVDRFEKDFASYTGAKYAIATVNGTSALHICLLLSGVKAGDEVLCPTLTFAATANAIAYTGAMPHFVDSSEETLGVCPKKLSAYLDKVAELRSDGYCYNKHTDKRISAMMVVHIFGHVAEMQELLTIAKRFNIEVIEDAAEALGSYRDGQHAGTFGKIAAFSFNGNKIITTGGGGMIVTSDESIAKRAKHLTTTARVVNGYVFAHDEVGYNYRLPNINAALGCAQLESLNDFLKAKRELANKYKKAFSALENATFIAEPKNCQSNYWLCALKLEDGLEDILQVTNEAKIMTRPLWDLMHTLPMYQQCPRAELSVAEKLRQTIINIPSSAKLFTEEAHAKA